VPLYEYECKKCHFRFEKIQKYSDRLVRKCPKCKTGRVEKLLSAPAVQFKGTGWYVTDYAAKKESKDKADREPKSESSSGGKDASEKSSGSEKKGSSSDKSSSEKSSSDKASSGKSGKSSKS